MTSQSSSNTSRMSLYRPLTRYARRAFCGGLVAMLVSVAAAATDPFIGCWALTTPAGEAGWLEIKSEHGQLAGSIMWARGYVIPILDVAITDGQLSFTRTHEMKRPNAAGKMVNKQEPFEKITARVMGDDLKLTRLEGGQSGGESYFTGRRIPPPPPRPDLAKVKFGEPIALLNGRDLSGWQPIPADTTNGWSLEQGTLTNRTGEAKNDALRKYANLRTVQEFEDFNLKLEVKVPEKCDSGVYLRGIYEVQIFDSFKRPLTSTKSTGALQSRIVPTVAADKPPGEWQTMDITLVNRYLTVVLNGTTVIDNQPVQGCTGGALWPDEFRPGPIYLQGDHGPVEFRNLTLRPVLK